MISKTFGDLDEGDSIYIIEKNGERDVRDYPSLVSNGGILVTMGGKLVIMKPIRSKSLMMVQGKFYIADKTFLDFYEDFWGLRCR